jgi:hypothetical protein
MGFFVNDSAEIVSIAIIGTVGGWAERLIHCHPLQNGWSAIEEWRHELRLSRNLPFSLRSVPKQVTP